MDAMHELRDYVKTRIACIQNDADARPHSLSDATRELAELEQAILDHRPS
jgi:hypothetical protein